mmetsp:Transcript_12475/g.22330  ORF Transcript_12475/g.22330 Transcript_12475/m.22330 type:complete len:674 (-) Transcript_12475:125-2146(-)|eukprot:CAMPEP_0175040388 /NCGR_PEP_ID=MMETSP0052_2-20121109/1233_1 /TAXON_ID=51329 ORGANISM="Polytomella parva, Strain SAG 63-3" /NCGR_SAMPLE_ID=MMETSP0052_2 /ASSEMBLY_ACC=CAM_ASM_000194 /LENGTH=673 /DNA_ID=CAMNT_0016302589 /DNA_START=166 /DNA_END=2187 /DNA_ORIENTATION=-
MENPLDRTHILGLKHSIQRRVHFSSQDPNVRYYDRNAVPNIEFGSRIKLAVLRSLNIVPTKSSLKSHYPFPESVLKRTFSSNSERRPEIKIKDGNPGFKGTKYYDNDFIRDTKRQRIAADGELPHPVLSRSVPLAEITSSIHIGDIPPQFAIPQYAYSSDIQITDPINSNPSENLIDSSTRVSAPSIPSSNFPPHNPHPDIIPSVDLNPILLYPSFHLSSNTGPSSTPHPLHYHPKHPFPISIGYPYLSSTPHTAILPLTQHDQASEKDGGGGESEAGWEVSEYGQRDGGTSNEKRDSDEMEGGVRKQVNTKEQTNAVHVQRREEQEERVSGKEVRSRHNKNLDDSKYFYMEHYAVTTSNNPSPHENSFKLLSDPSSSLPSQASLSLLSSTNAPSSPSKAMSSSIRIKEEQEPSTELSSIILSAPASILPSTVVKTEPSSLTLNTNIKKMPNSDNFAKNKSKDSDFETKGNNSNGNACIKEESISTDPKLKSKHPTLFTSEVKQAERNPFIKEELPQESKAPSSSHYSVLLSSSCSPHNHRDLCLNPNKDSYGNGTSHCNEDRSSNYIVSDNTDSKSMAAPSNSHAIKVKVESHPNQDLLSSTQSISKELKQKHEEETEEEEFQSPWSLYAKGDVSVLAPKAVPDKPKYIYPYAKPKAKKNRPRFTAFSYSER